MKKPQRVRRKARFRVGQVVWCNLCEKYDRIVSFDSVWGLWILLGDTPKDKNGHRESELRPLTAKEIGPRR